MFTTDKLLEKWNPVLDVDGDLTDRYKRSVTATVLENTEKALAEERGHQQFALTEAAPANATGSNIGNWDPILISLVRRAMPNLIAYDIAGVQPMTGPTGLIFAMKSKYSTQGGTEALFNEADTDFSGANGTAHGGGSSSLVGDINPPGTSGESSADANSDGVEDAFHVATGAATATAEALGDGSVSGMGASGHFNEMAFSIEKATVTAKSRALKAEYSMELAQDLKAIHGLDAESELANILSAEILAEINREVVRTINAKAKAGSQQSDITAAGTFDVNADSDGRWSVEKYKGLLVQLMREANVIAKETRRGKGNFILCSSDVAAALSASGLLDYTPALAGNSNLTVDDTGTTFAGTLSGGMKVYIDPYANIDYMNVGYKGANPYDAGIFYCPYVPLTMVRAVGENTFQPKIGFKTRYGMVANPFVGSSPGNDTGTNRANQYYRITKITNILS
ncbi:MAG: ATP-binding protein [Flavobacteriaceae bacterium]|jgi:hypothetical protein|nr:ATP-binding protein [Flavobacteriaceae bacterium]|tara:strand:- start:2950 stop:4311 length:1362 start_codon:yes stop_codon:yes gene_type:complete